MELVYTYGLDSEKVMKNLLDEDFFKRIGPTVRECKIMEMDQDGFCMYIKARDEVAEEAKKLLAESPAKPLEGESGERLMQAFREEAEAAEAGMGAMFG
jgi:hypothetical protein